MKPTVRLNGVSKRYGTLDAVLQVSFALAAGETVALVGHNGAGKTTLFKLMLGLIHPTAGSVHVLDEDPAAGEFAAHRRLGFLPENISFNAALTGQEILRFYSRLKREPTERVESLLERVGLGEAGARPVRTYSKGMRQRLGLAQALIGAPEVLLLDEPTTGLDPAFRLGFYDIVEDLRARGATVVLSSHLLTELEERANRVIIMNHGRKVADGSIDELRCIARLPTRIRLTVAEQEAGAIRAWIGPLAPCRVVNGNMIEIDAPPDGKLAILRRATEPGTPVRDVDVVPPTLDALYTHFLRQHEASP